MRRIYIKLKKYENFNFHTPENIPNTGSNCWALRNINGHCVIIVSEGIRRSLVHGYYIINSFGNQDKWFTDENSGMGRRIR